MVALLIAGSAISLLSCRRSVQYNDEDDNEGLITQQADSLIMIDSKNGNKSYRFQTPLMEIYDYAREPYREFRKGVMVETYSDSTEVETIETTLVSDYAINFINQQLWEAKGNVVVTNAKGQVLKTQQLFWNQRTGRIYSNVDSKLTQGEDVIVGVGFESDEQFEDWEVRQPVGKVNVEVEPNREAGEAAGVPETGEESPDAAGEEPEGAENRENEDSSD